MLMSRCPICGSSSLHLRIPLLSSVYSNKPYGIGECKNCKDCFTTPAPEASELADIYGRSYSYEAHLLISDEKIYRAEFFADVICDDTPPATLLEVGCMHGYLLDAMKRRNVRCKGVELSPDAVQVCRDKGLDVENASLEQFVENHKVKYDVVVFSHVLEHVVDPVTQLKNVRELLAPGGRIIVISPNSLASTAKVFGKYWGYWQVPVHINHFNEYSLSESFRQAGLDPGEVKFWGADSLFFLSTLANLAGLRSSDAPLSATQRTIVRLASLVLRRWLRIGTEDVMVIAR